MMSIALERVLPHSARGWMLSLWLVVVSLSGFAHAGSLPELKSHVTDSAQILSANGRAQLEARLRDYETATGHQFAFVSVPELDGGTIEDFSLRLAEAWRLGDKSRDDGLLLVVAQKEHKVRIEVGYGLEGAIPDALAARVIRHQLVPAFKTNDYEQGISIAFDTLMKAAEGEAVRVGPPDNQGHKGRLPLRSLFWLVVAFLFVFINRRGGPSGGAGARRRYYGTMGGLGMGLGGRGFGGGLGGGSFGGGFGGGGGGFGGGGSSGGW